VLILGTRIENINFYYKLVSAAVMGNAHGIKLFINVLFKRAESYITLYKIIALQPRLSNDKLIHYQLDFRYFGLNYRQHDYVLLKEAELHHCTESMTTVCPPSMTVYSTQIISCESSLFSKTADTYRYTERIYSSPTLRRPLQEHGSTWLYHLPDPQIFTMRCWKNNIWTTHTKTLVGTGNMVNTTGCSIWTNTFRTFPELLGKAESNLGTPHLYVPEQVPVAAEYDTSVGRDKAEPYPMAPGIFLLFYCTFILCCHKPWKTFVIFNWVNNRSRKLTVREYVSIADDLSDVRRSPQKPSRLRQRKSLKRLDREIVEVVCC